MVGGEEIESSPDGYEPTAPTIELTAHETGRDGAARTRDLRLMKPLL